MLPTRKDGLYQKSRNLFKIKWVVQLKNEFNKKEDFSRVCFQLLLICSKCSHTGPSSSLTVWWRGRSGSSNINFSAMSDLSKQTNKQKILLLNVNCFGIFISKGRYLHKHCPEYLLSRRFFFNLIKRYLLLLEVLDSLCYCVTLGSTSTLCVLSTFSFSMFFLQSI